MWPISGLKISFEVIDGCSQVSVPMITSGLTECAICWSSCSLLLQDWKFMFTMRRGLLKAGVAFSPLANSPPVISPPANGPPVKSPPPAAIRPPPPS